MTGLLSVFSPILARRTKAVPSPRRTRVMIYGAGQIGMAEARRLMRRQDLEVAGFIDDNRDIAGLVAAGLPIHSGVHIDRIVREAKIDRVILAVPEMSERNLSILMWRLDRSGCSVGNALPLGPSSGEVGKIAGHGGTVQPPPGRGYQGETVLVTGAGGTIGSNLCRQLLALSPARLLLLDLSEAALYGAEQEIRMRGAGLGTEIVPILGSVCDQKLLERLFSIYPVGIVLHAAAYKHVPMVEANPRSGIENNVIGTATLAQKAHEHGVRRFVLVSSDKAVRPEGVMGASKRLAEFVVQDYSARPGRTVYSIVRFGNVLGSSGSVLPLFHEQIARGGPVTLTDPETTRYFMTVDDAVRLVLAASSMARGGEIHVFDMGRPVPIAAIARDMISAAGLTVRDKWNPDGDIEIVTTGLRPGEKLHEDLTTCRHLGPTDHPGILVAREPRLREWQVSAALRDLRNVIDTGSDAEVKATALRWCREDSAAAADALSIVAIGQCA